MGLSDGIKVVAVVNTSTDSETFHIIRKSDDPNRVRIKASNGFFLQVIRPLPFTLLGFSGENFSRHSLSEISKCYNKTVW